jgi:SM-20-related protein
MSVDLGICDALAGPGWIVIPHFLTDEAVQNLNSIISVRSDDFIPAGIGRKQTQQVQKNIRGDEILWVNDDDPDLTQENLRMSDLKSTMNKELYLSLVSFEWHFARYAIGSFYQRHSDQHQNNKTRAVTVVQYLNQDWLETDGGHLEIFLKDNDSIKITPQGGTLVVFMSEKFEHQVLPASRERLSLTGWYRQR